MSGGPDAEGMKAPLSSFSKNTDSESGDFRLVDKESYTLEYPGPGEGGPDAGAGVSMQNVADIHTPGRRTSMAARSFGQMTVGGIRHSMLTLTSTALGGGMLAVSYVMYMCGLGLGIIMLVSGAILAYISTIALMEISQEVQKYTYASLFAHCAGPVAAPILDAMLFIFGNGSCIGYFVFLGDFIPDLVKLIAAGAPEFWHSRWLAICVSCAIMSPLVVVKDIAALRYVSPVSLLTLSYVAIVIAAKCASMYSENRGQPGYGELQFFELNDHIFEAFALCVFAFNCHLNVVPVAGAMIRPTKSRIVKVSYRVNAIQVCFYLLIACTGYTSHLGKTPQDILNGYDTHDGFMAVGRALLSLTMMVAIPINMFPTVRSGLQFYAYFRGGEALLAPSPAGTPPGSPQSSPRGERPPPIPTRDEPALPRVCMALTCLIVQAAVAIQVPGVADVMGLLGASVATAMMLVIPAYCIGKVMPRTPKNVVKIVFLLLFAVISMASIPVKILRLANILTD